MAKKSWLVPLYSHRMIEYIIMVFKNAQNCAYRTINMGFPGGSVVENPLAKAGNMGLIPELGRYPGEGNGNLLQYSCLENPWTEETSGLQSMGSQKRQTLLSD